MNIGGALATGIFALTVLTVVGAMVSYTIFKIRERRRRKNAPAKDPEALEYFVEYRVAAPAETSGSGAASSREPRRGLWARLVASTAGLLVAFGALVAFLISTGAREKTDKHGLRGGVEQEEGRIAKMLTGLRSLIEQKTDRDAPQGVDRGPALDYARLRRRPPSLFPFRDLDRNSDGRIQAGERQQLHGRVPQFILVTSDDNDAAEGIEWILAEARKHGFANKVTFFNTANGLEGRKNHLGPKVTPLWQQMVDDCFVGLHGTTHELGADTWNAAHWHKELTTVMGETMNRLTLPRDWTWEAYPWGSRAPFLMLTDAYFHALGRLPHPVLYDASLQLRPGGNFRKVVPPREEIRDMEWPFSLEYELPRSIDRPLLPNIEKQAEFGRYPFWEVPVYEWYLRPIAAPGRWEPSLDVNLWKYHGCEQGPNQAVVDDLLANLQAHYRGNRAPFHIGLHARQYLSQHACPRATMAAIFEGIRELYSQGMNLKWVTIPELLLWLDKGGEPPKE